MGTFADGSIVYIAACGSYDPVFRQAFIDENAGVYFGWVNSFVGFDDNRASAYLVDRLLGLNDFFPR